MKPTLSNLESMQINASLETVEQLSGELRQARKDIERWKEEYVKLQILQNDTNAKYGELVGKYKSLEKLNNLKDDYVNLLIDEINSLIGLANVHGWKSQNVEKGEQLRAKINELKAGLPTDK